MQNEDTVSTKVNVEDLVAQIRKRIAEESSPIKSSDHRNGSVSIAAVDLEYRERMESDSRRFLDLDAQVETSVTAIGGKPPVPPTPRGRVGSLAVDILRRLLWWYAAPIKQTFDLLNRRNREQAVRHRQMQEEVLFLKEGLQQAFQRLQTLETTQQNNTRTWQQDLQKKLEELENRQTADCVQVEFVKLLETQSQALSQARESVAIETTRLITRLQEDVKQKITQIEGNLQGLRISTAEFSTVRNELASLSEMVRAHAEARDVFVVSTNGQIEQIRGQVDELKGSFQELKVCNATSDSLRNELAQKVSEAASLAWGRLPVLETRLDSETEARTILAGETNNHLKRLEQNLSEGVNAIGGRASQIALSLEKQRSELLVQEHRVSMFLRELRGRLPETLTEKQVREMTEKDDRIAAMYAEFEDVFRGPRDEIEERQKVYLSWLNQAGVGTPERPALDLGCGRGEWLGLLAKHNLTGCGVDLNPGMINRCTALGLNVVKEDALTHLRNLPDRSLGAITSFHMVEHLPFETVLTIVDEALRVLQSGGLLIFETPNPQNALVGSQTFWIDPTHIRPIPSQTLRFFVEARGFCNVEVVNLQPYSEAIHLPDDSSGLAKRFNDYFYGPQDYGVIGHRP
jgi:O-antigen chain-terminating methyltransferase